MSKNSVSLKDNESWNDFIDEDDYNKLSKGCFFYPTWDNFWDLEIIDLKKLFKAVREYGYKGILTTFPENTIEKTAFNIMKFNIDNAKLNLTESIRNGKKGGRPQTLTEELAKQALEEQRSGISQKEIADKMGVSQSTISRALNNNNFNFDLCNIQNPNDNDNVNVKVKEKENVKELPENVNVTPSPYTKNQDCNNNNNNISSSLSEHNMNVNVNLNNGVSGAAADIQCHNFVLIINKIIREKTQDPTKKGMALNLTPKQQQKCFCNLDRIKHYCPDFHFEEFGYWIGKHLYDKAVFNNHNLETDGEIKILINAVTESADSEERTDHLEQIAKQFLESTGRNQEFESWQILEDLERYENSKNEDSEYEDSGQ